jgi:hypothetical protein
MEISLLMQLASHDPECRLNALERVVEVYGLMPCFSILCTSISDIDSGVALVFCAFGLTKAESIGSLEG